MFSWSQPISLQNSRCPPTVRDLVNHCLNPLPFCFRIAGLSVSSVEFDFVSDDSSGWGAQLASEKTVQTPPRPIARLFLWSTPILPRDHVSTNIGFSLRYMPWISLRQIWFRLRWFLLQIYGQFGVTSDFTTALFLCSYPLPFSSTILSVLGAPVSIVNDTDFTPVARLCVFLFANLRPLLTWASATTCSGQAWKTPSMPLARSRTMCICSRCVFFQFCVRSFCYLFVAFVYVCALC